MGVYSENLPQLQDKIFITDAGMETELFFTKNIPLPEFASYDLLKHQEGYEILFDYYSQYGKLGREQKMGLVLETPTWRANPDWGKKIGDDEESLARLNSLGVALLQQVRREYETDDARIVISGCIGPRGDGYCVADKMSIEQAREYHSTQIVCLEKSGVDMVSAFTINYSEEAIGIVLAARNANIPVVISFTVETDGRLPSGESLAEAITRVDQESDGGPAYYMINCAHPTHVEHLFDSGEAWIKRIRGIRGNASCKSHAELDEAEVLDEGNPEEFGQQCYHLHQQSNRLTILGGCCGTDIRHIEQICQQF